jgi:hypothetical protein
MKTTTPPPKPLNPVLQEEDIDEFDKEASQEPAKQEEPTDKPAEEARTRPHSNGRYRLLADHVIHGGIVPAGTEVGNDCDIAWDMEPTNQMEGVDEAGKESVNKLHQRLYGRDAPWHDERSSHMQSRRDAEGAEKQREEEKGQEPVSMQQAHERGHEEYRGQRVQRPTGPPAAVTKGGDTTQPMGPATADQNKDNPDVQVRTTRPLEDQRPK